MSFINKIGSALGKLVIVGILTAAFFAGMIFVVYKSLQGSEVAVPEIVGKNFADSERELEALGLRIKKRADRYSQEAPNTILEQIPHAGDTVKTGQMILVVISKANPEGEEAPTNLKKGKVGPEEEDDTKKIEELISDQPKKKKDTNSNTAKKKASATRDVISNSNTSTSPAANTSKPAGDDKGDPNGSTKDNKNTSSAPAKTPAPKETPKPAGKPSPAAETRPRRNPD